MRTDSDSFERCSELHFHMSSVPFWAREKILLLSSEKKAATMGFLLPEKVNGRKLGSL